MVKESWRYLSSFWYNTGVWRTNRRTDGQSSSGYTSACIARYANALVKTIQLYLPLFIASPNIDRFPKCTSWQTQYATVDYVYVKPQSGVGYMSVNELIPLHRSWFNIRKAPLRLYHCRRNVRDMEGLRVRPWNKLISGLWVSGQSACSGRRSIVGNIPLLMLKTKVLSQNMVVHIQLISDMSRRRHLLCAAIHQPWSSRRPAVQHSAIPVAVFLPSSLRAVPSLTSFRRRLKTELFDQTFY